MSKKGVAVFLLFTNVFMGQYGRCLQKIFEYVTKACNVFAIKNMMNLTNFTHFGDILNNIFITVFVSEFKQMDNYSKSLFFYHFSLQQVHSQKFQSARHHPRENCRW